MKKNIGIIGLGLLPLLALIACVGGFEPSDNEPNEVEQTPIVEEPKKEQPTEDDKPIEPQLNIGSIQGRVKSDITNVDSCQLYLYDFNVSHFADDHDTETPAFKQPDATITGTAPLATALIKAEGRYSFTNVNVGSYKLVLNCIAANGVQDESLLSDDPIQYQGFVIPNPAGVTPNIFAITVEKDQELTVDFIDKRVKPVSDNKSDVVVSADITDAASYQGNLYDMWNTINRISPKKGVQAITGLKANLVRMLGGVNKKVDGKSVPDLAYDVAIYNEQTNQYVYNFQPLISRIDAILDKGKKIHQIVLDQPPWAFQTGYNFIPDNQKDGVNFREKERVSHYGNSLPPKDKDAYHKFLQATMQKLIDEYGKEQVLAWRFRIGSEIETPDHWFGTEQDFVEHFANSVQAIRAVLPEAIVGLHTRGPNFVYRNGMVTNYKNEPIKSFANALIEYCYDNNIKYDFWGVSDYPFINEVSTRDPKTKYEEFFKPLVSHPKWQKGTIIDIEEFSIITKMGGIPEAVLIGSDSPQADTFFVALTDNFYQNGVDQIFQWGLRDGEKPWRIEAFQSMLAKPRVPASLNHNGRGTVDNIGAIVVTNPNDKSIQALTYHYDPKDIEAVNNRQVTLSFAVDSPIGTAFSYRQKLAAPEHHAFHTFMKSSLAASWLKDGKAYDKYGNPDIVLNTTGMAEWQKYQHSNESKWSSWQTATTVARGEGKNGSLIEIDSTLPLFSFEKTEVKF